MKRAIRMVTAAGVSVALTGVVMHAQSAGDGVDLHVAAARAAATPDFMGVFERLCVPAVPSPVAPQPAAQPPGNPPRAQWYAEPVKVFDNLYFVGEREYSAWAVMTSEGIIVIDPLFDYSVEEEVVNGLKKLGADPTRIRYVLVSHAHRDHAGGARLLQERFGARVVMTAADWDLLQNDAGRWPKPARDMVATDGQKLTLGDTTLTLHFTPGHTFGTISTLIPVRDGGRSHLVALWGGTAFNWVTGPARYITPERPPQFWFDIYSASARRFRDIVTKAGADVVISNHTNFDGSKTKLPALATRRSGEPHPYVVGTEAIRRYLTVAEECALAGRARLHQ